MKNGIVSTGVHVVLVHAFFLLDHNICKETVALIDDIEGITYLVAKILHLYDDLEGTKVYNIIWKIFYLFFLYITYIFMCF